jgi:hypothetical protein
VEVGGVLRQGEICGGFLVVVTELFELFLLEPCCLSTSLPAFVFLVVHT